MTNNQYRKQTFQHVAVGEEFLWGGFRPETCNWGRKRSSRTGDYRVRLDGKLSDHVDWAYWHRNEPVYVLIQECVD